MIKLKLIQMMTINVNITFYILKVVFNCYNGIYMILEVYDENSVNYSCI